MTSVTVEDGTHTKSISRFIDCDDDGAVLESDGQHFRMSWSDLQRHASFPEKETIISEVTITTELGTFECLLYEVERGVETHRFWFALGLPGMPIKQETVAAGSAISTTTVVSSTT